MGDTLTPDVRRLLEGIATAMRAADQLDNGDDRDGLIDVLHDAGRMAGRLAFPRHRARATALSFSLLRLCSSGDPRDVVDVAVSHAIDEHP